MPRCSGAYPPVFPRFPASISSNSRSGQCWSLKQVSNESPFLSRSELIPSPHLSEHLCVLYFPLCVKLLKRGGFLSCSHFIIMKLVIKGLILTIHAHTQCISARIFSPCLATLTKSSYYTHLGGWVGGVLRLRFLKNQLTICNWKPPSGTLLFCYNLLSLSCSAPFGDKLFTPWGSSNHSFRIRSLLERLLYKHCMCSRTK